MSHYAIITIGWAIGQLTYAAISVYILQYNKSITYWQAWGAYGKKELGNFVIAFCGLLALLFIANDFFDLAVTKQDLLNKQQLNLKEKLIMYQRSSALALGGFCQHLLYIAFKRGKKEIEKISNKNE